MMQKLKQYISELRESEKKFLRDGKRTIAKYNLKTLCRMSVWGTVLAIAVLLFGYIVPKDFLNGFGGNPYEYPSPPNIAFIFVMLIFAVLTNLYRIKGKTSPKIVTILSLFFEFIVFIFTIAVDIFVHPGMPANFMPVAIVIFSATLFYSTNMTNIINLVYTGVFCFCALMVNVDNEYFEMIARLDIFFALVGFSCATAIGYHFRQTQIQSFTSNARYKTLSMLDPLLGNIYNKRGYEDAIDNYLVAKNPNVSCAFIVLDLNDFKHINDNYGHDMGDQILKCMSDTLVSLFRDSDIIGRFGGDEFIVLADGLCDEESVRNKCKYIADEIGYRAQKTGAIKVFSSLGAVICDGQRIEFERLFELADEAMYEAKERGRKADQFVLRRYTDEPEQTKKSEE